jgi:hypothetical protein
MKDWCRPGLSSAAKLKLGDFLKTGYQIHMEAVIKKNARSGFRLSLKLTLLTRLPPAFSALKVVWFRFTHWETWDWRIKYLLIAPAWLWFCLRARSLWFFTASNPTLTFGGFDGESKREMYAQLPPGTYPKTISIPPDISVSALENMLTDDAFSFPFIVKPDVGKMGFMFRIIRSQADLHSYHERMHAGYIIQELVTLPIEVSVFYYRMPGAKTGTITGFIRKEFPEVTGDGSSTLWKLIQACPQVQFRLDEMKAKHKNRLHHVPAKGEVYCLSPALNLSRGGKLVSLEAEKDENLLKVFDHLSHYTGTFYYGRYDIKCQSVEELKKGRNFSILEYNGSGAEPHHVYGNGYNIWQACAILVSHWRMLYQISRKNHEKGHHYWGFKRGWVFLKKTAKALKALQELDSDTAMT